MLRNNNQPPPRPRIFLQIFKKLALMEIFGSKNKTCPVPLIPPLQSFIRKISFKFDLSTNYTNVDLWTF
jgi:hypothetical protein